MSSKTPVVRQMAWLSIIPQLLVMGIIILIWYQFNKSDFIIYGAITYLVISQLLRRTITNEHGKGMVKIKRKEFEAAIPHFKKSYEFFKKNDWIDKFRFLTLLSSGKMEYKEMALNNIAFCYGQTGNGQMSKEYYEKLLEEYPNNEMAKIGLRFLNSISKEE